MAPSPGAPGEGWGGGRSPNDIPIGAAISAQEPPPSPSPGVPGEGTVAPASVLFTPQNWNIAQSVTITGVDDQTVDGNAAYTIITGAAVSTDAKYSGLNPSDVSVVNQDNDTLDLQISNLTIEPASNARSTAPQSTVVSSTPVVPSRDQPKACLAIA